MNKAYIIAGIAAIIVVIAVILLATAPVLTLDQILANSDCVGLDAWVGENIGDKDLDLAPEQQIGIRNLALDCGVEAIDDLFGQ